MSRFDILLWDVDGTLLDFVAAESAAIRALFLEYGYGECTQAMLEDYSRINRRYWKMLELGQMTKPQILVGRFREFFQSLGLPLGRVEEFNADYQQRLGDTIVYKDDSFQLVSSLKGAIPQYAATNGTVAAQIKKLKNSGFDKLLDGVFMSEELGYEKPDPRFFQKVFESVGPVEPERVLIVGDSLTSDMEGGRRAGIATCWYNPQHAENDAGLSVDYEIDRLWDVKDILGLEGDV